MKNRTSEFLESLRIAFSAIRANKSRGVLTTLGIVIGIVSVVTTMTAANGLGNSFRESISAVGSDVLYVSRMPWIITGNFFEFRNRENLSIKEADKLSRRLKTARAVNPSTSTRRPLKFRSDIMQEVTVIGTTDQHILVSSNLPEFGRFLSASDVQYRKKVCIIGSEVREKLFANVDPINKKMKIGRYSYRVVGIMEEQGSAHFFGGPNFDRTVYIPISTFMKNYGSRHRNFDIAVKAPSQEAMADFEYSIIGEMRKIRKLKPTEKDNFSINQMNTLMDAYNTVMGVIISIGLVITSVSLFVGGIGVMNIMFVSVTERTREIGIRKAIGAKKRTILTQFLIESSAICLIGGFIGIVLSYGVTEVINATLMPASLSPFIVIVAMTVSVAVGLVAGIIPAFRAARLNPIDALRYE